VADLGGRSAYVLDIAVKPGRHVAVSRLPDTGTLIFGLPRNPVAALVSYELFMRPALSHLLRAMAAANALALLPDGDGVQAGEPVQILLLHPGQL
jgi:molybdopterin biosynthesis enzyme